MVASLPSKTRHPSSVITLGLELTIFLGVAARLIGTLLAIWGAVRLPPAEAMRPEPPPLFRPSFIERLGVQR